MTVKEVTWLYRQLGILVQFSISTECNLLIPDSLVTKICAHGLTSVISWIAWPFFSIQQAKTGNYQKYGVTEWAVCTWVTSKLTYWYVCDICSVASREKGYQALPLLSFRRHHAGGVPGNKAEPQPVFHNLNLVLGSINPTTVTCTSSLQNAVAVNFQLTLVHAYSL